MEIKLTVDISEKTEAVIKRLADAIETGTAMDAGDFAKLAKGHQISDQKPDEVETMPKVEAPVMDSNVLVEAPAQPAPEISKDDLRAYCAKAKAAGINVSAIIKEYGHADLFRNMDPQYYGAVKAALDKAMK